VAWRDLPAVRRPEPPTPPEGAGAGLRVLASGSRGNCSVLVVPDGGPGRPGRVCLIDAGLSPSRTRRLLADCGLRLGDVDDIVLTHLDRDHFHTGWPTTRDCRATLRLHRRHVGRAQRFGLLMKRNEPFDDAETLCPRVSFTSTLAAHDDFGVAAFRWSIAGEGGAAELGYATDLGRATPALTEHLRGVDVLAIESNYCPNMQAASGRPAFLKRRITGGSGHLSNAECAEATTAIGPRSAVVLLHLSQECNRPDLAAGPHEDGRYRVIVSSQIEPTEWVWVGVGRARERPVVHTQGSLFAPGPVPGARG
jgi:phosphoribosyl 1,2-cyclic phosphodiesterase